MVFNKIIRKLFRKSIIDPVFGKIAFYPSQDPCNEYWDAAISFPRTDSEVIAITICANEDGPSQQHRDLFEELRQRWDSILSELSEKAQQECMRYFGPSPSNYQVDVSSPEKTMRRLHVGHVSIENLTEKEFRLEFSVMPGTVVDEGPTEHPLVVIIENWKIISVSF